MTDYRRALVLMPTDADEGKEADSPFDIWLEGAGWDPTLQVLQPASTHQTLGWKECVVIGCNRPAWGIKTRGLCSGCLAVWRDHGQPDIEVFAQRPSRRIEYQLHGLCSVSVDGVCCQRRASSKGLCKSHADKVLHHTRRGRTRAEVIKTLIPLDRTADCSVIACDRQADFVNLSLCVAHRIRWQRAQRGSPVQKYGSTDTFEEFCRTASQVTDSRLVVFTGLKPRVTRQILYGVYTRSRRGSLTRTQQLQQIVDYVRAMQVNDLREVKDKPRPDIWPAGTVRPLLNTVLTAVEYGDLTPEDFRHAEVWPGAVFGKNSQIDFRNLTQPWLQEMAQAWCWDNLHRFGDFSSFTKMINEVNYFSEYLRANTTAGGCNIAVLDRATVSGFAAHIAELARTRAPRAR
ncbi:MAG: hypothetical protein ACRDDJ_03030, partial [[Mycobacterium] stephanolepidis]